MSRLHIVQASNEDFLWLQHAANSGVASNSWIVPKCAEIDDDIVIFSRGHGFVATAKVMQKPARRDDWVNRYGAAVGSVELISPPISIGYIRAKIPALTWAKYPRSITTPLDDVSCQVRELVVLRRTNGVSDLPEEFLRDANLAELRLLAKKGAVDLPKESFGGRQYYLRSCAVRRYALERSNGICEYCESQAPFLTDDGEPYLEVHHMIQLADDGPDDPENVIALCPNCHRKAHHSSDADEVNSEMIKIVSRLESVF